MTKIKKLRLMTGLTQTKFGELLYGIPLNTIQNWENERQECPDYVAKLIEYRVKSDNDCIVFDEEEAEKLEEVIVHEEVPSIDEIIKNSGYTQKKFAEILGCSVRNVENWSTGKSVPPDWVTRLIAEKFSK